MDCMGSHVKDWKEDGVSLNQHRYLKVGTIPDLGHLKTTWKVIPKWRFKNLFTGHVKLKLIKLYKHVQLFRPDNQEFRRGPQTYQIRSRGLRPAGKTPFNLESKVTHIALHLTFATSRAPELSTTARAYQGLCENAEVRKSTSTLHILMM